MAYIRKRGKNWSLELLVNGKTEYASFPTRAQASLYALERRAELRGDKLPAKTLDDALDKYLREKAPKLDGDRWARNKIRNLRDHPLAKKRLEAITGPDIAQWRDERLAGPKLKGEGNPGPATVNRELNLLRSVFEAAVRDWGYLKANPMAGLKRPKNPRARRRRISQDEIEAVCKALGYVSGAPANLSQRVALAFLFALETAMRGGEIVRLQWAHVGKLSVHLPKTKNGDARDVPLSLRARAILELLPRDKQVSVFQISDAQRDALFRKGRVRSGVQGLHFHDTRAEAIWRLSKKLDVMELARMIGHRNISSLMFYYETTADELAAKLG